MAATAPEQWGVDTGYHDVTGAWRQPPASTIDAILESMGASGSSGPPEWTGRIVAAGDTAPLPSGRWRLELEDGGELAVETELPPDLPLGYHRLAGAPAGEKAEVRALIVAPARCHPPPARPSWGWSAQLYATRSSGSWGMGDLGDLARLASWSAQLGASALMMNPLHAGADPSPYFASSRCFRDPGYLAVAGLPGAAGVDVRHIEALNAGRRIDRDAVWRLKSPVLEEAFAAFVDDPAFDRYLAEQGPGLVRYATFCALVERHGPDWHGWPASLARPDAAGVEAFANDPEGARRIRYHAWLQWQLDRQLADAGSRGVGLISDLAIGARDGGADSWMWQECTAPGMRIGAPPDDFNASGQDWALPPLDPWKLRSCGYEPFIQAVRAALRHAGGVRIDHVMGLFRLFWIPPGAGPADGTYVRYPASDLLAILALESHRAGAYVIGEDLGTVEDGVRHALADRGVLSYRLLWFEHEPPRCWPAQALGAVTTHDLPTVAGLWTGRDLEAQREIGLAVNEASTGAIRDRLEHWCGAAPGQPLDEVIVAAHAALAEAPATLVTATLDDACGTWERPNMPGTTDEWPNWSIPLPMLLEELEHSELALRIAACLDGRTGAAGEPIA